MMTSQEMTAIIAAVAAGIVNIILAWQNGRKSDLNLAKIERVEQKVEQHTEKSAARSRYRGEPEV